MLIEAREYKYPRVDNHAKVFELSRSNFQDEAWKKLVNIHNRLLDGKMIMDSTNGRQRLKIIYEQLRNPEIVFLKNIFGNRFNFYDFDTNRDHQLRVKIISAVGQELDKILLDNVNNNLPKGIIKGDLISFDGNINFIFDGCDAIDFIFDTDFLLPKQFEVVKQNISVNYWSRTNKQDGVKFYSGDLAEDHTQDYGCVNFDHRPYRGKMIRNLKVKSYDEVFPLQTEFQANNKTYTIKIQIEIDENSERKVLDDLSRLFEQQKKYIPFTVDGKNEDVLYLLDNYDDKADKYF